MMIIPRTYTFYGSVGLFVIFGLKMLHEGYTMDPNDKEELNEVEDELKKKDEEVRSHLLASCCALCECVLLLRVL